MVGLRTAGGAVEMATELKLGCLIPMFLRVDVLIGALSLDTQQFARVGQLVESLLRAGAGLPQVRTEL
jgi:hypothetical protein